jgi:hypothetical protein
MKALSVSAQVPANKEKNTPQLGPVTVTVQTGETAAEKIQMFGDEAVSSNADANWVVTLQSNIRAGLKKGETQDQVQARLASAKMGVSAKGATVDPTQAYQAQFLAASPEAQVKMIKELQKRAEELRKGK